jgi:hypothetical protein
MIYAFPMETTISRGVRINYLQIHKTPSARSCKAIKSNAIVGALPRDFIISLRVVAADVQRPQKLHPLLEVVALGACRNIASYSMTVKSHPGILFYNDVIIIGYWEPFTDSLAECLPFGWNLQNCAAAVAVAVGELTAKQRFGVAVSGISPLYPVPFTAYSVCCSPAT